MRLCGIYLKKEQNFPPPFVLGLWDKLLGHKPKPQKETAIDNNEQKNW